MHDKRKNMKHVPWLVASLVAATPFASAAPTLEFRSVGGSPAIMYDAPSTKGHKVFIAPRGMPVEVVLTYGEWVKVRDASGDLSWVEAKTLTPRRTLVVKVATARIRTAAEESAPLAFTADKGVLLDLVEPAGSGWVKVRHRDGHTGFVRASEVWGE
jgi:SH3-like domain-containing protein